MGLKKKKTKKIVSIYAFFSIFLVSTFLLNVHTADAGIFSFASEKVGEAFYYVINVVLYSIFLLVSFPVSWSAMLFGLTVDPVAVNTMFKMNSIYVLWQMVRDFFNLFFILTLLFIAFATIFQIDSFNYKKTLGKLLLMALLVNFSFPIARFVIDVANVPMYFFMESMFKDKSAAKAADIANVAFSTSGMKELLLPGVKGYSDIEGKDNLTLKLLVGIIFMFLFGVSLLVLAVLFLIRSLMLVVLIIFSSVGFAGMVIPGFRSYATKWWESLLRYAFFGPAAMLMLLVSVKFMQEFTGAGGIGSKSNVTNSSSGLGTADEVTYLAAMVAVMAPIIMIWMSIVVAQNSGIAGAKEVAGRAQQFSKWAGRKTSGVDAAGKRWKAYSSERDARAAEKFKSNNIGTRLGKFINREQDELIATGGGGFYSKGKRMDARNRFLAAQKQKADETAKQHGVNENMNDTMLQQKHEEARKTKDKSLLAATTKEMSRRKLDGVTAADLHAVQEQFGDMDGIKNSVASDVKKEMAKANPEAAYTDKNGVIDEESLRSAIREGDIDAGKVASSAMTSNFVRLAAQEGKLNEKLIDEYQKANPHVDMGKTIGDAVAQSDALLATHRTGPAPAAGTPERAKYDLEEKRLKKANEELNRSFVRQTGDYHATVTTDDQRKEVLKKADHETLAKMADNPNKGILAYNMNLMAQVSGPGKTAAVLAKMSEEGKDIQKSVDELKSTANNMTAAGNQEAKRVVDRMKGDYRFDGIV